MRRSSKWTGIRTGCLCWAVFIWCVMGCTSDREADNQANKEAGQAWECNLDFQYSELLEETKSAYGLGAVTVFDSLAGTWTGSYPGNEEFMISITIPKSGTGGQDIFYADIDPDHADVEVTQQVRDDCARVSLGISPDTDFDDKKGSFEIERFSHVTMGGYRASSTSTPPELAANGGGWQPGYPQVRTFGPTHSDDDAIVFLFMVDNSLWASVRREPYILIGGKMD